MREPAFIMANSQTNSTSQAPACIATSPLGFITVTPYAPNVLQVKIAPSEELALPVSEWGISGQPPTAGYAVENTDQGIVLATTQLSTLINAQTGVLTFRTAAGKEIIRCLSASFTPVTISREETTSFKILFSATEDERFYGLGQHQYHALDQRGKTVQVWHSYHGEHGEGESIGIPFLVTNRGYGIMLSNTSRITVTPGVDGVTTWEAEIGEAISFYLIAGENIEDIYQGYRLLTGETPLPPKGALGYIQCKQRYETQDELLTMARKQREKGYPCDMLVVDWFHWKVLGDLDLDPQFWPDPTAMNEELSRLNYSVMISVWPRFKDDSRHFAELDTQGWLMTDLDGNTVNGTEEDPRGAVIDTMNPQCRRWYWEKIFQNYAAKGFKTWWLDEDEPDVSPYPFKFSAGTGARLHNLYGLTHTQGVYEGHRRDMPERCLILSRSAYLGAQHNGITCWSSDIEPTWDVFRRQLPAGLNFCASGFAYWSSDIGGWQPLPEKITPPAHTPLIDPEPARAVVGGHDDYPELYVRWFQYGAFCPTFRAHGTRPENEVWSFGPVAEAILVKYLNLRYQLLPYIYAQAYHTYHTGMPFMRPLFMDFPQDRQAENILDQYMFGPAFLVAPVIEQGGESRDVYLPAGATWYNFWSNERFDGGQTITVTAPIDTLPLFVRAGAIIPVGAPIQHTRQVQAITEIRVYTGADGACELYDDDGLSYGYEQGNYSLTKLAWNDAAKELTVTEGDASILQAKNLRIVKINA